MEIKLNLIIDKTVSKELIEFFKNNYTCKILDISNKDITDIIVDIRNLDRDYNNIFLLGVKGNHINPMLYREKPLNQDLYIEEEKNQDLKMLDILQSFNFPKIGFSRGAHLLTSLSGGKIIQEINGHKNVKHNIDYKFNEDDVYSLKIESNHSQMMYPYILRKGQFEILAWSTFFESNKYIFNKNNINNIPNNFLEPEILLYNNSKSLCFEYNILEQNKDVFKFSSQIIKNFIKQNIKK